jgi:hypothetical protein
MSNIPNMLDLPDFKDVKREGKIVTNSREQSIFEKLTVAPNWPINSPYFTQWNIYYHIDKSATGSYVVTAVSNKRPYTHFL